MCRLEPLSVLSRVQSVGSGGESFAHSPHLRKKMNQYDQCVPSADVQAGEWFSLLRQVKKGWLVLVCSLKLSPELNF